MTHVHEWREVFEESLVGGYYPIGFRCRVCGAFEHLCSDRHIQGIGGTLTKERELVGPHGGLGNCSDGSAYRKQIYHEDGRLEIIR